MILQHQVYVPEKYTELLTLAINEYFDDFGTPLAAVFNTEHFRAHVSTRFFEMVESYNLFENLESEEHEPNDSESHPFYPQTDPGTSLPGLGE